VLHCEDVPDPPTLLHRKRLVGDKVAEKVVSLTPSFRADLVHAHCILSHAMS
jgi:hypothetical protein